MGISNVDQSASAHFHKCSAKLSSDQITLSSELLPEKSCANPCTSTAFRVCAINPHFSSGRPYGLHASGSIMALNLHQ